ncbi:ParB/RepB/Spo0J family partition protein [Nocardia veterana]|uniref:ParB N-terminal domain-containing protein n=1 Tax=Nocardia veterana TaxID=132249 RepID=A0A7X6M435_9NOCA|nr:ParB N-terminal domain-containing protein [Nocardia veterana]NKY88842.1 ParB N-terminal domain-containing protein [Nocardia veterana]
MTTTEKTNDTQAQAAAPAPKAGDTAAQVVWLETKELVIAKNRKTDPAKVRALAPSIKQHGNFIALQVIPRSDGRYDVRDGAHRVQAARKAKVQLMKAEIISAETDLDEKAAELARLDRQFNTGKHVNPLSATAEAQFTAEALELGLEVEEVAKRFAIAPERVRAARTVARSTAAQTLAESTDLDLMQIAVVEELGGDDPATVERLVNAAKSGQFEHVAAQVRSEREAQAAWARAAAEYRERGFTVREQWVPYQEYSTCTPMRYLRTADGAQATEEHVSDPAHWVVQLDDDEELRHAETGEPVEENAVDWDTDEDPEREPAEGLMHASQVRWVTTWKPLYYCTDLAGAGLTSLFGGGNAANGEPIDAEAAAKAEAERKQAERAARRRVIAANRLARAATIVRRDWLRERLSGAKPFKGAAKFTAHVLTADATIISEHSARDLAADLLGLTGIDPAGKLASTGAEVADKGSDNRAQVILFALAAGAIEGRMQAKKARPEDEAPNYWRMADQAATSGHYSTRTQSLVAYYLQVLREQGYVAAPIERVPLGELSADEAIRESEGTEQ